MIRAKTTPEFNRSYAMLNKEQRKAVDTIEGPVMVIAGPGTGKTQILTLRIAHILKQTDTDPSSILALTFTEAGVAAMRKRLVSMIGSDAYRVAIHTFHGFCNMTIQRFPEDFPRLISSEQITDIDQILMMREIIEKRDHLNLLRPFHDNFAYVKKSLNAIGDLKSEYVEPDDFKKRVEESEKLFYAQNDLYNEKGAYKGKMKTVHQKTQKSIEKNKELVELYDAYEAALCERKLYDYNDMISVVVRRLDEDRDVLQRLQEEYQYVLADEHQDANASQNRLLELLVDFHEDPNLFIVGDEKQAIYRFQGASLENFLYFTNKYPNARVVELKHSYRSGQNILDVAHSVISSSDDDIERVALESRAAIEKEAVEIRTFASDEVEALWVARDIEKHIGEGVEPDEIVVLYRTNADAAYIAQALERERISYSIESNRNVLDDTSIAQFVALLRTVADFGNKELVSQVLHVRFLGFEPIDIFKILKYSSRNRTPVYDCIFSENKLKDIGVSDIKQFSVFAKRLSKWAQAGNNDPVTDVFNLVLDESGFLTTALNSSRSVEMLEKLHSLARTVEELARGNRTYKLQDLIAHLDLMDEYNISIKQSAGMHYAHRGVRLMTAHKAKGLEFDYVYLVGAWDTHWGNKRSISSFTLPIDGPVDQDNADERRLFYVALTRARSRVSVSYGRVSQSGKDRLPSQFIEEMNDSYTEDIDESAFEERLSPEVFLQAKRDTQSLSVADSEYLKDLFIEQGLSVTALNNYLTCPWQYFYSNLVRIPKIPTKYMTLGTAVDRALKTFFVTYQNDEVTKDMLLDAYEKALEQTSLSGNAFTEMYEQGHDSLSGWFDTYQGTWCKDTLNAYKIDLSIPLSLEILPNIRVRGELDKAEVYVDGITVVDYKTGKPKSRNHIIGKTKAVGSGNYFRQLVFYRMLIDAQDKYKMKNAVLDFIQPKENGTYVREEFTITQNDVDVLLKEIEKMSTEVLNLSFWDKRCDKHQKGECEYCKLRELMQ
ncbi:MAG: hypothetical protein CMI56_03260 [Parcubacteria group bacterium]|nr:hypothetical protein [Parcubacteria group bacterium]